MLSFLKEIDTYEITVESCRSETWSGLFNFKPSAEDVAAAIRETIRNLDKDVEHEYDMIQSLRQTLELVTLGQSDLLGPVEIAGTLVGEISLTLVKIFVREPQSMMPRTKEEIQAQAWCDAHRKQLPELRSDLVNRVPELTDTSELTDISELIQQRADARQFDGQPDECSVEALEEHLTTDPRSGENWPSEKIQTSEVK